MLNSTVGCSSVHSDLPFQLKETLLIGGVESYSKVGSIQPIFKALESHPNARKSIGKKLLAQWGKPNANIDSCNGFWLKQKQCPIDEEKYLEDLELFPQQEADFAYRDQWLIQNQ